MGMVVRTNTMSTNAYRNLSSNQSAVAKSLEKLSSGFRISRAGDDAAGLAISEKMKAQIKGLEQASANSQDGISLIQTAEGATQEIHNMLNRMVELATKSANGTIQNDVDREAIQKEVSDLNSEITRIAQSTNFNGINLLNGDLSSTPNKVDLTLGTQKTTASVGKGYTGTIQIQSGDMTAAGEPGAGTIKVDVAADGTALTITLDNSAAKDYSVADIEKAVAGAVEAKLTNGTVAAANVTKVEALKSFKLSTSADIAVGATAALDSTAKAVTPGVGTGLKLQVGDTNANYNHVTVSVDDLTASGIGTTAVDVSTQDAAGNSIQTIKDAINQVSTNRANLGSLQNRLEYTINNLDTTTENMSAANSRIRDTDMAKEMMNYTKMNILTQAAQAMLAQANQQPQSILQLLQ